MSSVTDGVVAFLGPAGTFSEQAVRAVFGREAKAIAEPDFDAVLDAVESGEARFGVIAIENNTNGTVTHALDLLLERRLCIVGEVSVPVVHNLLTLEKRLEDVRRVYAHAQALAQCRGWLSRHMPDAERIAVSSNAEGARRASIERGAAGIAAIVAADIYGLRAAAKSIQDGEGNRTRFLVMAREPEMILETPKAFKTSIVFSVPNVPGSLYDMMTPMAENGVQMVRIESRPARNGFWDYNFFIDVGGSVETPGVREALAAMEARTEHWRLLGSYPVVD